MTTTEPDPTAPLVVTADDDLLAELLPLAAAADVVPVTTREAHAALPAWGRSPAVLVGADQADAVALLAPERRAHVYVLTRGPAPDDLFRTALRLGADQVIDLPGSTEWLTELLADLGEQAPHRGRVIGVMGGSGGAGATTFAAALAQRAAARDQAVVIDCDPQGPGMDRVLGLERAEGFRWDALCRTTGRLSARSLREALPHRGRLRALSWYAGEATTTLQPFAAREALSAARRGHGVVVVDLPRTPDPFVDEVAGRCDELLLVCTDTVLGVSATARMRQRFAHHAGLGLVLRGEALAAADVARTVHAPVRVQMRDQRRLAEILDLGGGPAPTHRGPLARAAATIVAA
ncbi:hypothetical protein KUV85_12395 [Nocardioides panacisoli]|uniref:septum site-determining protein Ssd n=1 Tax=Nocardioides panacisoli TaxID=627624 RepID=UPI001C639008|nr:septum site-determining protein Ssd [Nocardioides panacisoli]QYJ03132.1 hypothetical protein KUV85_12395 [Nocardioides panacisoli]